MATPARVDALLRWAAAVVMGVAVSDVPSAEPRRPPAGAPGDYASPLPLRLAAQARRPAADLAADIAVRLRSDPAARVVDAVVEGRGFVNLMVTPRARVSLVGVVADDAAGYLLSGMEAAPGGGVSATDPRTVGASGNAEQPDRVGRRRSDPDVLALSALDQAASVDHARGLAREDARRRLARAAGQAARVRARDDARSRAAPASELERGTGYPWGRVSGGGGSSGDVGWHDRYLGMAVDGGDGGGDRDGRDYGGDGDYGGNGGDGAYGGGRVCGGGRDHGGDGAHGGDRHYDGGRDHGSDGAYGGGRVCGGGRDYGGARVCGGGRDYGGGRGHGAAEVARLLAVVGEASARVAFCASVAERPRPKERVGPGLPARPTADEPGDWARLTDANPAFAIRYAHAHAVSSLTWARDAGWLPWGDVRSTPGPSSDAGPTEPVAFTADAVAALCGPAADGLVGVLFDGPGVVAAAVRRQEPHMLVRYLGGVADAYHEWRGSHGVAMGETTDPATPDAVWGNGDAVAARLELCAAVAGVLGSGLFLLGVSAPTRL